jgi:hypothetical protein
MLLSRITTMHQSSSSRCNSSSRMRLTISSLINQTGSRPQLSNTISSSPLIKFTTSTSRSHSKTSKTSCFRIKTVCRLNNNRRYSRSVTTQNRAITNPNLRWYLGKSRCKTWVISIVRINWAPSRQYLNTLSSSNWIIIIRSKLLFKTTATITTTRNWGAHLLKTP